MIYLSVYICLHSSICPSFDQSMSSPIHLLSIHLSISPLIHAVIVCLYASIHSPLIHSLPCHRGMQNSSPEWLESAMASSVVVWPPWPSEWLQGGHVDMLAGLAEQYQPWLCSVVASVAVGLAGIVPLVLIPSDYEIKSNSGECESRFPVVGFILVSRLWIDLRRSWLKCFSVGAHWRKCLISKSLDHIESVDIHEQVALKPGIFTGWIFFILQWIYLCSMLMWCKGIVKQIWMVVNMCLNDWL